MSFDAGKGCRYRRVDTKKYDANYDKIFGDSKCHIKERDHTKVNQATKEARRNDGG